MLTHTLEVDQRTWKFKDPENPGYVLEDDITVQRLLKVTRISGKKVWSTVIETCEVPQHVLIELGCTGMTTWKSPFAQYI